MNEPNPANRSSDESQSQQVNYLPGMPDRGNPLVEFVARLFRRRGALPPVVRRRDD